MYLIYVDESGKPDTQDPEDFVLAACMVNERDWQPMDNRVRALKVKWFPAVDPDQVELHATKIVHASGPFKVLGIRKFDLLRESFDLISKSPLDLMAVCIRKAKLKPGFDIQMWAWRLLFERICLALGGHNIERLGEAKPAEYGLLLVDSVSPSYDLNVRKRVLFLIRHGTFHVSNEFLIEDPLFVTSQYRSLSQVTDMFAYCIRRKLRPTSTVTDKHFDGYFEMIKGRLRTRPDGKYEGAGLKIFP